MKQATTNEKIKEIFLAHGFKIPPELTDMRPYVYEAARALLRWYAVPICDGLKPTYDELSGELAALKEENQKLHHLRHEREDVISELRCEIDRLTYQEPIAKEQPE